MSSLLLPIFAKQIVQPTLLYAPIINSIKTTLPIYPSIHPSSIISFRRRELRKGYSLPPFVWFVAGSFPTIMTAEPQFGEIVRTYEKTLSQIRKSWGAVDDGGGGFEPERIRANWPQFKSNYHRTTTVSDWMIVGRTPHWPRSIFSNQVYYVDLFAATPVELVYLNYRPSLW